MLSETNEQLNHIYGRHLGGVRMCDTSYKPNVDEVVKLAR